MGRARSSTAIQTILVLLLVVSATAAIAAVGGTVAGTGPTGPVEPQTEPTSTPQANGTASGPQPDGTATGNATLTVLTYNDIQTAASNADAMGRLVGTITERRAAHANPTVVVGGGDQVSPSSLSPTSQWHIPVELLNVLGPDAEVVGNHDLDYGFEAVANFSAASEFPWLLANVVREDGSTVPGTKNYTIVERGGVRVGIVGLVDEAIEPKTAVDFDEDGYRVADYSEVGGQIATDLTTERGVDVVIAAAHIGVPDSQELARETENIDLIVTGDDEVVYEPATTDGTVVVEAGARGEYVGEVNLTVADDGVSLANGRSRTVGEDAPTNETARRIVADAREAQLDEVVGRTTVALDSTFASNYHDETAWGNLITDAVRAKTGAEVAVTNSGGIRGDFVFGPGNVTYDDVYTSLPFGNHLVTKELTGEQLRQLLASQVVTLESEEGQQYGAEPSLQVSGVTYEYVPHENAETVVQDVSIGGDPLDPDATYNVTLNSYMAGWTFADRYGWSMAELPTVDTDYTLIGTVVASYIGEHSPVSPPRADRIRRVDRSIGETNASIRGPGPWKAVTVRADLPAAVSDVNASTVRLQNATTGSVQATYADVVCGSLVAVFDGDAVPSLQDGDGALELYGSAEDVEYGDEFVYFDRAVVNAEVSVPADEDLDSPRRGPWTKPAARPGNGPGNHSSGDTHDRPWEHRDDSPPDVDRNRPGRGSPEQTESGQHPWTAIGD